MKERIAYFGLGKMGIGPALNLQKAGYEVHTAVHRSRAGADRLAAAGGVIDASPAEALRGAKVIFSIVPDDAALEELALSDSFLDAVEEDAVLVEMTSCSAKAVRKVAEAFEKRGAHVLDAPVSGGTVSADNGTMSMMCAGSREIFERMRPYLEVVGKELFLVSEQVGDGKKVKSLNNLLGAANRALTGEVWRIAQANGLDPEQVFQVICASSGNSTGFRATWPRLMSGEFTATFTVAHMRKDVNLAGDLAEGLSVPLTRTVQAYYRAATEFDAQDSGAIAKVVLPEDFCR